MKQVLLLSILFLLSTSAYLDAQNNLSKKEDFETTYKASKALVKTKAFQFLGHLVYSGKNREKLEPNLSTISLNNSEISGQIVALSERNKIFDMAGKIKKYKLSFNDDDQQIVITFNLKGNAVKINIKPNGQALLTYDLNSASDMFWMGKLIML